MKEQFMYAVIETGGKQYRVQKGDVLDVERPASAVKENEAITFDRVLFVGGGSAVQVGAPVVSGVTVKASVVSEVRGPKVLIFKKKKRKGFRRLNGHRQDLVRVRIEAING
jgi:large subunit ribosomal protein L21